jgi:hypothetical protein
MLQHVGGGRVEQKAFAAADKKCRRGDARPQSDMMLERQPIRRAGAQVRIELPAIGTVRIGLSPYLKSSTPATSTNCMPSILGRMGSCRSGFASSWSFWPGTSKSARLGLPGTRNRRFDLAIGLSGRCLSFTLLTVVVSTGASPMICTPLAREVFDECQLALYFRTLRGRTPTFVRTAQPRLRVTTSRPPGRETLCGS